jgi:hypothetical protein
VVAVVAVTSMLFGLAAAPVTFGKAKSLRCKPGTVPARVGGKAACMPRSLALPAPSSTNSIVAQIRGALGFTQVSFRAHSGKRVKSFSKQLGRAWTTARSRLLTALSVMIARVQQSAGRRAAVIASGSWYCAVAKALNESGIDPGSLVEGNTSATIDGISVTMGIDGSGSHIGFTTTSNGDVFTMKYDSGDTSCLAYELPPCPQADGSLNAYGVKGKDGFSLTVTRAGQVLKSESYAKTTTVETRGQVANDARLDDVLVKYGETSQIVLDGVHVTQYGNRTVLINMRTRSYGPGESVSFGSASADGVYINRAGEEASAQDYASFVSQAIKAYSDRENAWQTPNACAKLKFDPQSGTLTLSPGDQGKLSAEVDSSANGEVATKANWTLSAQQNGTFSPTSTKDQQPSFSYEVSGSPTGSTVSVNVRATSTAGVAQDTWSQQLKVIKTVSGTFTGHATDLGLIYDWTGRATFTRVDLGTGTAGPGGVFQLTSGQATVTISGSENGSGCQQTGTTTIGLFGQSPWTVTGSDAPFSYQVVAPFASDPPQATNINCSNPQQNGTPAGLGSMPVAALQSGDIAGGANLAGLVKTTNDLYTYSGSASATGPDSGETTTWTWSFTGSP